MKLKNAVFPSEIGCVVVNGLEYFQFTKNGCFQATKREEKNESVQDILYFVLQS